MRWSVSWPRRVWSRWHEVGRRLAGWSALSWQDRLRLIGCAAGLALVHAGLAAGGYVRTRRVIERLSRHATSRDANAAELAAAKHLARLAAIAGHHGAVEASCLRQSLLVFGWLRRRGLQPVLQLGLRDRQEPFQAHAWIELGGVRLLPVDAGHRPFVSRVQSPDAR